MAGRRGTQSHDERYLGQKFGQLTIVELLGRDKFRKRFVRCLCECGKEVISRLGNLRFRKQKSCPTCKYINMKNYEPGQVGFNKVKLAYMTNAKSRNLEFSLCDEEFRKLTKGNCYYCGSEPKTYSAGGKNYKNKEIQNYGIYIYNGIDRLNNDLGYTTNNCVSCCESCNKFKLDLNEEDFLNKIKKIYLTHFGDKNVGF